MAAILEHMFDDVAGLTTGDLDALVGALSRVQEQVDDGERIEQLSALERVKAAVAAAQARVTVGFVRSQEQIAQDWRQRSRECADAGDFDGWRQARENAARASLTDPADAADAVDPAGPGAADQGDSGAESRGRGSRRSAQARQGRAGVAAQVALARREAPSRGSQHVNLALRLVQEMPGTYAALASGVLSEWRAWLVVREAAVLAPELRTALDAELCAGSDEQLGRWGDRELTRRVKAIAYRLDPASVAARSSQAEANRRVSLRPAPDTMAYLTALLPVAQAVAAHAALTAAADTARAAGDERGKGQVMADTLVERLTGQAQADAVPVEVQVVMSEGALFAGADTPAQVPGYGTVPAQWARDLLTPTTDRPADHSADHSADSSADGDTGSVRGDLEGSASGDRDDDTGAESSTLARRARVWLRRLYAHPQSGGAGRDGLHAAGLRRRAAPVPDRPRRRVLSHAVV